MSLNQSIVAIFHALNITVHAFDVQFQIFDVLISYPGGLVQLLPLNDLLVLLTEESLLQLDSLGIRSGELLDLIVKGGHGLLDCVAISQSSVQLAIGLLNSEDLLVDGVRQCADSVIKLALLTVQDLEAQFLVLDLFLTASEVTLLLENVVLLLLLNIVVVSDFAVKTFDISS